MNSQINSVLAEKPGDSIKDAGNQRNEGVDKGYQSGCNGLYEVTDGIDEGFKGIHILSIQTKEAHQKGEHLLHGANDGG